MVLLIMVPSHGLHGRVHIMAQHAMPWHLPCVTVSLMPQLVTFTLGHPHVQLPPASTSACVHAVSQSSPQRTVTPGASPTQQKLEQELIDLGFSNFKFVRVPGVLCLCACILHGGSGCRVELSKCWVAAQGVGHGGGGKGYSSKAAACCRHDL